jgi:hypothetical protein
MLGEQAAIVDPELWEEINAELRKVRRRKSSTLRIKQNALLSGLLFCRSCDQPMVPTYTSKGDRRYRLRVPRGAGERMEGVPDKVDCGPRHGSLRRDATSIRAKRRGRTGRTAIVRR